MDNNLEQWVLYSLMSLLLVRNDEYFAPYGMDDNCNNWYCTILNLILVRNNEYLAPLWPG